MHPQTFAATLFGSMSTVSFYWNVLRRPVWFSVRFFLMSCLLIGLLDAAHFNLITIPNWRATCTQIFERLDREYPTDLVFNWDQQQLTWQPDQVITVPYPPEFGLELEELPPVLAQLTPIDAPADQLVTQLPQRSLVMITPAQLYVSSTGQNWNQVPLRDVPGFEESFSITRDNLSEYISGWQELVTTSLQVVAVGSFMVIPILTLTSLLLSSLIDATLFYFLIQFSGVKWRWSKVWQLTLHILVVALIIETLVHWALPSSQVPVFALASWGLFAYIMILMRLRLKT